MHPNPSTIVTILLVMLTIDVVRHDVATTVFFARRARVR